jgi:hypothetical protein
VGFLDTFRGKPAKAPGRPTEPRKGKHEAQRRSDALKPRNLPRRTDTCPHCRTKLDPIPQRKKKCPFCSKVIFVCTHPSIRKKVLATEEEAKRIDNERLYRSLLKEFEISEREYRNHEMRLKERYGRVPSRADVVLAVLNARILTGTVDHDWNRLQDLYRGQVRLLLNEDRNPFVPLREAARCQLLSYQVERTVRRVEIMATPDSCDKCKREDGRCLGLDEALRTMPIPVEDCANGHCRCTYTAAP